MAVAVSTPVPREQVLVASARLLLAPFRLSHLEQLVNTVTHMKRLSLSGLGLLSIFVLGACETDYDEVEVRERERGGFRPPAERRTVVEDEEPRSTSRRETSSTEVTETEEPVSSPSTTTTEVTETTAPTTTPPPAPAGNYEYGKQVPGKPGFVTSPHSPYSGYVDVRGFPPGTEVKDPYTGKIFLVP